MEEITNKSVGVSVIVCCYNSQDRLPETIRHLALQNVTEDTEWEIIIVNNASTDYTKEVAIREWENYNSKAPFRVVDQPKPGLSAARLKGIETACYEYLLFCDDDNWLQADYVSKAFDIIHENEEIGALGGVGRPAFEIEPPSWYNKRKEIMYALGEQGEQNGDITDTKGYVYGAGMVVRYSAIEIIKKSGFTPTMSGRYKNSLLSGEDNEICYAIRLAGYRIWYNNTLLFKHYIPKERLDWEYYLRLKEMGMMSGVYLRPYVDFLKNEEKKRVPSKFKWINEIVKSSFEIAGMWKFYRRYLFHNDHYPNKYAHYRGLVGRIKGWFSFRGRYMVVYKNLVMLREKARELKYQAEIQDKQKNTINEQVNTAPKNG